MHKSKPRRFYLEGREYAVSISAGDMDAQEDVHVRISFRALFGTRSVCLVRGVTNRSYWHDYPDIDIFVKESISLTPRIVRALIILAHSEGWDPETSNANFELFVTKDAIRAIPAATDS